MLFFLLYRPCCKDLNYDLSITYEAQASGSVKQRARTMANTTKNRGIIYGIISQKVTIRVKIIKVIDIPQSINKVFVKKRRLSLWQINNLERFIVFSFFVFCLQYIIFYYFHLKMQIQKSTEQLYEQNQRLGHRINYLNDENNFYRISINNIKKLNQNINKNLLTSNNKILNSKNTYDKIDAKNITDSYCTISNKIQLKNLQMKVGNSKRRVDKLQKLYDGSISTLIKQAEQIEKDINRMARQYEYYTIQNQLLGKEYMLDFYLQMMRENAPLERKFSRTKTLYTSLFNTEMQRPTRNFRTKNNSVSNLAIMRTTVKIHQLQEEDIKHSNRLEQFIKEQKQLKKQRVALTEKISALKTQRQKLAEKVYGGKVNLREAQAMEVDQLKIYNHKELQLQDQIAKQDALLEQQYKINQEYKQKIIDRNQQQNKEIKVLQEQIKKCGEQVKEIKLKCQNLDNKNKKTPKK